MSMTPGPREAMLDNAVLVVAHPDDEVLWFSSVLRQVRHVVFCYLDHRVASDLGPARRRALARYPLKHTALGMLEVGTFNTVDWAAPVETESGLALPGAGSAATLQYLDNATQLRTRLAEVIRPYRNVITHNPWGEYGHPDHVQVYRVVSSITEALQRDLWFSNYVSSISIALHLRYTPRLDSQSVSFATDSALGQQIAEIYKSEGCWTWYEDFEWSQYESFVSLLPLPATSDVAPYAYGSVCPLNLIRLSESFKMSPIRRNSQSVLGQVRSALGRLSIW
jgi:LmbE family N-acetylglucosaminyl deacetylase